MKRLAVVLGIFFVSCSVQGGTIVERAESGQVTLIPEDDPHMARAMRHARSTLDEFFEIYSNKNGNQTSFAVKVGITDRDQIEYFWISDFYEEGKNKYKGVINDEPRLIRNVRHGQYYGFDRNEIVDWVYMEGEKMKGNFTACALLRQEPEEQREQFMRQYGLECDL
jgi:uncharacterized protein YegJ (DUF2314 family)